MTRYGIRTEYDEGTTKTVPLTIWSGPFMETWEARGTTRDGARRATFRDYSGERFTVTLPEGVTFPRTAENYEQIDAAISAAYKEHNARLGRVQMEIPA